LHCVFVGLLGFFVGVPQSASEVSAEGVPETSFTVDSDGDELVRRVVGTWLGDTLSTVVGRKLGTRLGDKLSTVGGRKLGSWLGDKLITIVGEILGS
jgi:hypothetical protein